MSPTPAARAREGLSLQAQRAALTRAGAQNAPWAPAHPARQPVLRSIQQRFGAVLFDTPLTFAATELATTLGLIYSSFFRRAQTRLDGGLLVVTGLPKGAYPRGGICIGRTFLTGPSPSTRVLAHEKRHLEQWQRYGALMPLLYAFSGRSAHTNWFEVEAGLSDGGYL